jgi:hypothetical protein
VRGLTIEPEPEGLLIVSRCDELHPFVVLDTELSDWAHGPREPYEALGDLARAEITSAQQFFFNMRRTEPTKGGFDKLIASTFDDLLDEWRDRIENGSSQPPGSLVAYFADCGHALWDEGSVQ